MAAGRRTRSLVFWRCYCAAIFIWMSAASVLSQPDSGAPAELGSDQYNSADQQRYSPGAARSRQGSSNYDYNSGRHDPNRRVSDEGVFAQWREDLQGLKRPDTTFQNRQVEISTRLGQVIGFTVYLYDHPQLPEEDRPVQQQLQLQRFRRNVTSFLGIPYAQPPVGDGRFKPPRPHPGWQSWSASDFRPACPQPSRYTTRGVRTVDEDCLYLNVYTPSVSSNVKRLYAVMLHIHGGEFSHGASNLFPGHMLASWGDVVVVTFNYRLGALGFLSTGDEYSPGNYGLLDQAMALRWVHENIHFFKGDKQRITLFGPDAGAASAGLLAVSPKTAHMVHQVIAQSGSALSDWAAVHDVYRLRNTSRIFGERVGCRADTSFKLLSCLTEGRNALEIGEVELKPDIGTFPWSPVVEKDVLLPGNAWYDEWQQSDWSILPDLPEHMYRQRRFSDSLRVLTGVNRDEAATFVHGNRSLAPDYVVTQALLDARIREWVQQYNYTLNPAGVEQAIRYRYTYWPDPNNVTWIRQMYIDFLSDALYKSPVDSMMKLLLELDVPSYQYVLNTSIDALLHPHWREVPHGLEYYFITGAPFMDPEFYPEDKRVGRIMWTERDRNISQFFMEAFSNFAKHGRPTPQQLLDSVNWEPAVYGDQRYLSINNTFNSSMFSNYRQTESAFWSQYLPTVVGNLVPTYAPTTEFWWEPREPLQIAFWSVTCLCFVLLILLFFCCCLWINAKKRADRLYEDTYMEDQFDVRENSHFGSKISQPVSLASLGVMEGPVGATMLPMVGGATAAPTDGTLPRGDARSVARGIQLDRRKLGSRDTLLSTGTERELETGEQASRAAPTSRRPSHPTTAPRNSIDELEPLQRPSSDFSRQPSRLSTRSRDTVQYATLEHTAPLAAVAPSIATRNGAAVPVLPRRPADRMQPHAKSIPNMVDYDDDEQRPPSQLARPKSTDQLEPARHQFQQPYEVLQLPESGTRAAPAGHQLPRAPAAPAAAPRPSKPPSHQAQIVVQMASRPAGGRGAARGSDTPPPPYLQRRAEEPPWRSHTPASSYANTAPSERSLPATPSEQTAFTDRSFDSSDADGRLQHRRYVPPETAL